MDVKTAFLNGELEKEIYMEQPEGFVVPGKKNKLKDNMLDPLTKGLSREEVERTSKGMGLRPRTSRHGERKYESNTRSNQREALALYSKESCCCLMGALVGWDGTNGTMLSNIDVLSAIDDALKDGVDIISTSIGGKSIINMADFDEEKIFGIGSFHAVSHGIPFIASAGNCGPDSYTVVGATSPWMISVASSNSESEIITPLTLGNNKTILRYNLRTIIDEVGSFPAKISIRSRMTAYREFKQILVDQELKKRFKRSYFGHLRNLSEHLKFNGQLVHYLLLRCIKNDKIRHEIWFCVNNKPACFGLKEFCLITGLNCSSYPRESKMKKVLAKGDNFRFKVTKNKNITAANLLHLIRGNKLNEDQKFKYCILWFLHTMLLAKYSTKVVDTKLIRMVDSLSFFEKYPWGKETFQLTMDYLKKKSDLKKQKEVFNEKQKASYALFEFPWEFMNVHPYIIPTVREMKMDYMITFESYTNEMKNNVLDGLKKELQGVTVLTSNEDSDDDGDLGGNPAEVCVGDDDSLSTSKDRAGTSAPGDLHKRVVALEEAVLDIAAYIKEKRMKKKENDERQHE
ncbi:hypothetical protein FXO38_27052 [Capsicum annuum]|nr:hypothetical protein FXO37_30804 [Capsicum annuum]KAF3630621.1 hypothetical protein FXO38_27052 [Capsicum annuum]